MKTYEYNLVNSAAVAAFLALGALGVNAPAHAAPEPPITTRAGHTAEAEKAAAEKYERDALTFEANADLHTRMAERYRAPSNGGSKQRMTLWSLANHYEWLAKTDREAAQRARNVGAMHRNLTNAQ
jgi:hypothetical protein